jgi:integrase
MGTSAGIVSTTPATASSRLSRRTSNAVGRVGVTVTRYVGPRGTTFGFRFWCHGRLSEVRGFSTRSLAIEAGRRERRRAEKAGFEARWGPLRPRLTPWKEVLERYAETKRLERKVDLAKDLTRLRWWVAFFERHGIHYLQALTADVIAKGRAALEAEPYAKQTKGPDVQAKIRFRGEQTVAHYLKVLRHLCNLAMNVWDPPLLERDPSRRVRLPTVDRPAPMLPDAETWERLLEHAKAHEPELYPVLFTGLHTGLREGAVMALSVEHFQERPGWLRAHNAKRGRGRHRGRDYWIPVTRPLAELIRSLGVVKGPLWRRHDPRMITRYSETLRAFPKKAWDRTRKACGLATLRFHDARHMTGSVMTRAGVDPKTVQTWLDHAQITTTLGIYAHSDEPTMLKAARTLERGLRPKKPRPPGGTS